MSTPAQSTMGTDPQTIEAVATWLETCCRGGSLAQRAEFAAALRLGAWRDDLPRRTAARDVPHARAYAERWIRSRIEQRRIRGEVRRAADSGAEMLVDAFGRPKGHNLRQYRKVITDLGMAGERPAATRVYEYNADGTTTICDGAGRVVETWPTHRPPRSSSRLVGHAPRRVTCLRCKSGQGHPGCECGEWWADADHLLNVSARRAREWHFDHKLAIRRRG